MKVEVGQRIDQKRNKGWLRGLGKERSERIEKGSRKRVEKERKAKEKLRRQFEEGLKFTWISNTRKPQVHFMMKSFIFLQVTSIT